MINALPRRAGRHHLAALVRRDRLAREPGQEDRHLPRRRHEPVHHEHPGGAVQRRARAAGDASARRPQADARPGVQGQRHHRQRRHLALGSGLRHLHPAARAGHRAGQVAAQGGRPARTSRSSWSRADIAMGVVNIGAGVRAAGQGGRRHRQPAQDDGDRLLRAAVSSSTRSPSTTGASSTTCRRWRRSCCPTRRIRSRTGTTRSTQQALQGGAGDRRTRPSAPRSATRCRRSTTTRAGSSSRTSRRSSTRYNANLQGVVPSKIGASWNNFDFMNYWLS